MAVKKGTELVRGSARKSIVPLPAARVGELALRDSRAPKIFEAIKQNEIAHAAEKLKRHNKERAKADNAEKQRIFGLAKKGEWEPVFDWLAAKNYDNINERDNCGRTLLMIAASRGNLKAAGDLVIENAYLGLTDEYGRSALVHALRNEQYEVAKFLKSVGAKWEGDLSNALRDRRVLLVKSMQRVLEISNEQVSAIEATLDPNRGPALSNRLKGVGDEANAQQELTAMFQPTGNSETKKTDGTPSEFSVPQKPSTTYNPGTLGC